MSSIDKKIDKITGGLTTAEKADVAVSTVLDGLEAALSGETTNEAGHDKTLVEIEKIISKLHPAARNTFSAEFFRRFSDFWIGKYLDEKHEATVWRLRFLVQGLSLQKVCAAASGDAVLPEDDLAPRIRRVAADLADLRTCGLWEDLGRSPPPLPEDIERLLADPPDPTA